MSKKTESRLKLAYDKYTMLQLMLYSIISKNGKWLKRKKDDIIFINDSEDVKIIEDSNGDLSAVQISNEYSCPITDPEIIDIINEIRLGFPNENHPKKKKVTKKSSYLIKVILGKEVFIQITIMVHS